MSTLKFDPNALDYCVELGEECWALDDDNGWYYLAVLNEVNNRSAKVTFIANQSVNAASYVEAWVPVTDIFNVGWGLVNCEMMYDSSMRNFEYSPCSFTQMLGDGIVLLHAQGHSEPRIRVHYDRLRLSRNSPPMYPYALMVGDIVKGIPPWEQNYDEPASAALREQLDNMRSAWGTAEAKEFEAFGRKLSISGAAANEPFLDNIREKYLPIGGEIYRNAFHELGPKEFSKTLNSFDIDLDKALGPLYDGIAEEFEKVNLYFPIGRFRHLYAEQYFSYDGYYTVLQEWNKKTELYNRSVDGYNQAAPDSFMKSMHNADTFFRDPTSMASKEETIENLLDSVYMTITSIVHVALPKAINDYLGVYYFCVAGDEREKPYTNKVYQSSFEKLTSPEGLDLLLDALQESPTDGQIHTFLYNYHAYKGCGLDSIINHVGGGGSAALNTKMDILEKWMTGWENYSASGAASFVKTFDEMWEKLELEEACGDGSKRYKIFRNWVENIFIIRSVAYHPYLKRLNGSFDKVPEDEYVNHLHLSSKACYAANAIEADLEDNKRLAPGNEKYIKRFELDHGLLIGLISTDGDYVMGKEISSDEGDPDEIREEIADVLELYRSMDFGSPSCVSEIEAAVNAHKHKDLLQQLVDKANRAKQLNWEIDSFLYETASRVYTYRQEIVYDIMRAGALEYERLLLEMKREDLKEWRRQKLNEIGNVFGEKFEYTEQADERYFEIMERAWIYQAHLNEKNDASSGFFKKITTAVSGVGKKQYEPDYMQATENGTRPLAPLADNEKENINSYWDFSGAEKKRLIREYQERYDPDAVDHSEMMQKFLDVISMLTSAQTLKEMAANYCRPSGG